MQRYSLLSLARHALHDHRDWRRNFGGRPLKSAYDVVIVGGGGHGLATAYYLAKNHGINNVAVVEKSWLGGGNTARNTTMIRSDYLTKANAEYKEFALKLWENLSAELNFNVMFSQRGYIDLAHSDGQMENFTWRANTMRHRGIDAEILNVDQLARLLPEIDVSPATRYPIHGALYQSRGGTARHDAVAWGYARAAHDLGVDIFEHCGVDGFKIDGHRVTGVNTSQGHVSADTVVVSVAGHSSLLAAKAGIKLPLESFPVQAFISEPLKPVINTVINFNMGLAYINQTDKGELVMGGGLEPRNGYLPRGGFDRIEDVVSRIITIFPSLSRVRLMRTWAGIADIPMDGSPLLGESVVKNMLFNCGWGYAGFKATPAAGWTMAATVADGKPHPLAAPFSLSRFHDGYSHDEGGVGPTPSLH